jgi:arylsulfatase A-like enzyme
MPNIIWITSEDNSPMLGCYGDGFATTPNLDRLASQGFRYTHCYANAPWLAPSVASWEKAFRNGQCNAVQSVFWNGKYGVRRQADKYSETDRRA